MATCTYDPQHQVTVDYIRAELPKTRIESIVWTSDPARKPNCMGYAVDHPEWWQPQPYAGDEEGNPAHYWPQGLHGNKWVASYVEAAKAHGFAECNGPEWEDGIEKICLFHRGGIFTHAAFQISPTQWKSKLGRLSDFEHPLKEMRGGCHGNGMKFLKRARKQRQLI